MVVLTYKFDESYKGARTLIVGGWLGEENQWKKLQDHWRAAIAFENQTLPEGRKISRYHASEMNAKDNEYEGWESDRMNRFTATLLDIVGSSGMTAIACGMDLAAFLSLFPHRDPPDYGIAYGICMKQLMQDIGRAMQDWEPEFRLAMIHDHGDWDTLAHDGFYQLVDDPNWEHRQRFVSITPLSSYDDIGLQAADLFAYEAMRRLDQTLWSGGNTMRKALQELLKRNVDVQAFHYTRQALVELKQFLISKGQLTDGEVGSV